MFTEGLQWKKYFFFSFELGDILFMKKVGNVLFSFQYKKKKEANTWLNILYLHMHTIFIYNQQIFHSMSLLENMKSFNIFLYC